MRNSVFFPPIFLMMTFFIILMFSCRVFSQDRAGGSAPVVKPDAAARAEEVLKDVSATPVALPDDDLLPAEKAPPSSEYKIETLLELAQKGGPLMYPIGFFSLLVVAVGIERFVMLRAGFVAPKRFFERLDSLAMEKADPRKIYNACRQFPSAAANVVETALMNVGRPMAEVQAAIQEAKDNEAGKLFGNVRILILAATVTPLIGLLGTVMGMITSFRITSQLSTVAVVGGMNKAEQLAGGIYVALITTFAALSVAIPASILAHWYEGVILKLFRLIDRKLLRFIVYMTEVEGKVHVTPEQYDAYYESAKAVNLSKASKGAKDMKGPSDLRIPADIRKPEGGKST